MPAIRLRTVTRTQGNNLALKDGTVTPRAFSFAFEEVEPLIAAFRRMVRGLEWDVCEMAATTYICARAHGVKFTAIPVFLVRAFHHGAILVNTSAGITGPGDLEGRRVGVNRGYTVTTGVWARGVLETEYGVDLSRITWVLSGDEHVAAYRPPANVVPIEEGGDMGGMLASGELVAAIGVGAGAAGVAPLIANPLDAGLAAMRARGHYPINHLVVIRDDVLDAHPGLAADIFEAFAEAKRLYVDKLRAGAIENPTATDRLHARVIDIIADPLPYGIEPNRAVLKELVGHAMSQKIISASAGVDELFAAETRGLVG